MRYALISLFVIFGLAGCYNEDKFATEMMDAACAKATECEASIATYWEGTGMDADTAASTAKTMTDAWCATTEDTGDDDTESTCSFNKTNAKDCVSGIEGATCEESATGWAFPDVCAKTCE